jgi:predicted metal-dependent HD superfamily phosphohydrolase
VVETTTEDLERLRARWRDLVGAFGVPEGAAGEVFADLAARYSEPARSYHTLRHVAEILDTLDGLRDQAREPAALRFAAWFHDAVYDTHARDNEERSAELAARVLGALPIPGETVPAARHLILLTRDHHADPADRDGQLFLDADLAILGAAPERYAAYSRAIRREYAWVPDEAYRAGRRQVLEGFLRRERIYHLDRMYAALEAPARRNLAAEIADLS